MLSPLMIISLDQGNLAIVPRSIGQLDARLLEDIKDCLPVPVEKPGLFRCLLMRAAIILLPKSRKRETWHGHGLLMMDAMHR
ncbi:hypothetical protein JJB09_13400 [Rhizobium sp. KVB221]|uniref:Uncharacterized protein n=1 Tax=Rhizobium setariae TaxID=2801340 RepID=A0A937CLC2_9HYPH|nr:hypothetical protein [Rhizobium setariae]MBL0373025.1 hypothetical protein [Rhizobium setariae]